MADRFYTPNLSPSGCAELIGQEARHLSRVMRRGVGDEVRLFDGRGLEVTATVTEIDKNRVTLAVVRELPPLPVPQEITLAVAVPKGERFRWLIEKCTELGVARIIPLKCERSVVRPRDAKLDKMRQAVIEASKQCGRRELMTIEPLFSLDEFFENSGQSRCLIADPSGQPLNGDLLAGTAPLCFVIGPEGGFTESELEAPRARGETIVSLGSSILRIETAAIAVAAAALIPGEN